MANRIRKLRRVMAEKGLDAMLITNLRNVRYLSGYSGSNGMMIVTAKTAWFYTDFRYKEQVKTEVTGCRKKVLKRSLFQEFPVADLGGAKKLGIEEESMTVQMLNLLRRQLRGLGVKLVPAPFLVIGLRRLKDEDEVKAITRAQAITDRVFKQVLDMVKPGARERDIAAEIIFQFAKHGDSAFPPIVASGPNGAKPHAEPTMRRLKKGDAVTFDVGCRLDGYCSDMTRTVFVGRPTADMLQVYQIVHEAQRRGLAAMCPGVSCFVPDKVARDYITDQGYGPCFGHSLGHGVGLDVHEHPTLHLKSAHVLTPGDVVTVEPGIYLPGVGGVRIEDMVLVTKTGYRNFTKSPKHAIQL